ncbi:RraA family protein [Streptomyces sp. NPDC001407]|uniref:RraA family protein n=1 Tax=unclassified Streptomyces TaxID=2593676 RepID=UPI0033E17C96
MVSSSGEHPTMWPTAALWDAAARLDAPLGLPPRTLSPAVPGMRCFGPLRRIAHTEGVASVFEGLDRTVPGEVLLIDNGGRTDEACAGDLVAIESRLAGAAGLLLWGCHRDTDELAAIGLPVFSLGPCPASPRPHPEGPGEGVPLFEGRDGDTVVADADGVVVVPAAVREDVLAVAEKIVRAERDQAQAALSGVSLREQLQWNRFLERRRTDPGYTFRSHLAQVKGALE